MLIDELKDLNDVEHQITKALPKMAKAASNPQLQNAFTSHLNETEGQIRRLEDVFKALGLNASRKTCEAMKGLLKEGDEVLEEKADPDVKDAALITAAQRVEHYEIAGYGTMRTFAKMLGLNDVAQLLQETLNEEGAADKKLTQIAERQVNPQAQ